MVEEIQDPFTNFNFEVALSLNGAPQELELPNSLCSAAFSECDGLEMTMEPKTVREGGNNTRQIHLAGPVSYGNLTLKRGMSRDLHLWVWFNAAAGSPASPKPQRGLLGSAVITMNDASGQARLIYKLSDCLPIKMKAAPLNAQNGAVAIEEMQIAYSHFTIDQVKR